METSIILFLILIILILVLQLRKKRIDKNSEYDSYTDVTKKWSIMTSFSEIKILSKYAGVLRFGPAFIHIKTEPNNAFGKEFYGDWFFKTENGIFLQKWNANPIKSGVHTSANNDLIYFDRLKNKIEVLETGIKSFHWTMEKDENYGLILISDNGKAKNRIKITYANNG